METDKNTRGEDTRPTAKRKPDEAASSSLMGEARAEEVQAVQEKQRRVPLQLDSTPTRATVPHLLHDVSSFFIYNKEGTERQVEASTHSKQ